jgi:hypothetical protein
LRAVPLSSPTPGITKPSTGSDCSIFSVSRSSGVSSSVSDTIAGSRMSGLSMP